MDTSVKNPVPDSARAGSREPTLGALFGRLFRDTASLAREEVELAKAELSERASLAGSAARRMAIGGAIAYAGFLALLVAATNAIALLLPPDQAMWLAPLIVGVVVAVIGAAMLASARSDLEPGKLKPSRTTQSLRRDARMVKEHVT